MTDGIVHVDRSATTPPEGNSPRPPHKMQTLGLGVYLSIVLLVGMTGGVVGGGLGLTLGAIVGVNYLPGFEFAGPEWHQTTEFVGAVVGFVVVGLLWTAVALWLLARK